jgi:hypothetical protein
VLVPFLNPFLKPVILSAAKNLFLANGNEAVRGNRFFALLRKIGGPHRISGSLLVKVTPLYSK